MLSVLELSVTAPAMIRRKLPHFANRLAACNETGTVERVAVALDRNDALGVSSVASSVEKPEAACTTIV